MQALRGGDVINERERRFTDIYEATRVRVFAYALRRTSSSEDAADAVAETYAIAWRRIDDLPSGDKTLPWLIVASRYVIANQRRGARRQAHLVTRIAHELERAVRLPELDSGASVIARDALNSIADGDRELLMLSAWDGLSISDLARTFDCSTTAIRLRLYRARKALRARLDESDVLLKQDRPSGHYISDPTHSVSASDEGVS
jgi:RNA polymerase sigma factor (sigma-70 family)